MLKRIFLIMSERTVLSDFLYELGVPHTRNGSYEAYTHMPFQSLYGFSKLLQNYNIDSEGLQLSDKSELQMLPTPFLAQTPKGFVIVTHVSPVGVDYVSNGVEETVGRRMFEDAWTGIAFLAYPRENAREPHLGEHLFQADATIVKKWLLWIGAIFLFGYLFVSNRIWADWSTVAITLFDLFGLYLTFLLVQKSAHFSNAHADRFCAALQKGGCDDILASPAAKFFGLFGWSEVGFAYFSVSLLCLLMYPQYTPYLAACNCLCLPFTLWSIWYQKFRAHRWCTLCVCTQATLWALFFCYLLGGWYRGIFPLRIQFFVLGVTYVTALLALNRLMPLIEKPQQDQPYDETNL